MCLHQLIEAQAERRPNALAVVSRDEQISYRELNERANQLAHYLQTTGVGPEVLVALMVDRSVEMIVALLGILKAGGAYLPLDPVYPRDRVRFMLEDSRAKVLVTESRFAETVAGICETEVLVDAGREAIRQQDRSNPVNGAGADNLIYVIYTSGSTGLPKGAMVGHREVINCLFAKDRIYQLNVDDRMLCKTTLNFDPSIFEIFWPLIKGAQVALSQPNEQHDSAALMETALRHQVTIAYFVPTLLALFVAEPEVAGPAIAAPGVVWW